MDMIFATAREWAGEFVASQESSRRKRVGRLLQGADLISPVMAAESRDLVPWLLDQLEDTSGIGSLPERVDAALAEWFAERLADDWRAVERAGVNAYVAALINGFDVAANLPEFVETRKLLRRRHDEFDTWCAELAADADRDIRLTYLRTLAVIQQNRGFLSLWYGLCDRAGRDEVNEHYLQAGLLGLKRLPAYEESTDVLRPEALTGLARWARHLNEMEDDREIFVRQWSFVTAGYDNVPATHSEQIGELLRRHRDKPFAAWLAESAGQRLPAAKSAPFVDEPSRADTNALLKQIDKSTGGVDALRAIVRPFVEKHERYVDATADTYDLPRAFNRVGRRVLKRAPALAMELAETALAYDANDAHSWVLWGNALEQYGRPAAAEDVFWEVIRRLPDNAHCRTELAKLLTDAGRFGEAEALHRDTIARFPNDETTPDALAHLLASQGRFDDAEDLFQDTRSRFRENPVCRLDLGLLLLDRNRDSEVEPILAELKRLRATEARTLRSALERHRQGEPHRTIADSSADPGATKDNTIEATEDVFTMSSAALRAMFHLSDAMDAEKLSLMSQPDVATIRQSAVETLDRLKESAPHHPVVQLIALRREGNQSDFEQANIPEPSERAPTALKVEWARTRRDTSKLEALVEQGGDVAPLAAVAWILCDDPNAELAADRLLQLYNKHPDDLEYPIHRLLRDHLHNLIPSAVTGDPESFLDYWIERPPEELKVLQDVLDIGLLSLVEQDLPYEMMAAAA